MTRPSPRPSRSGRGRGDLERGREDLLFDGVMQVAGEAVAGFQRRKLSRAWSRFSSSAAMLLSSRESWPSSSLERSFVVTEKSPLLHERDADETSYATGQAPGGKEAEERTQESGRNRQEDRADPHRNEKRRREVRQPQRADEYTTRPFLPSMGVTVTTRPSTLEESWPEFSSPSNAAFRWRGRRCCLRRSACLRETAHLGTGTSRRRLSSTTRSALVRRVVAPGPWGWRGPVGATYTGVICDPKPTSLSRIASVSGGVLVHGSLQARRHFVPEVLHHQPR